MLAPYCYWAGVIMLAAIVDFFMMCVDANGPAVSIY
jgi:hypothetical protein